ncbi:MAG: hypothetical protein LBG11_06345, partial [Bifidobacteriaceae bacterium]|nr:hypothetical protein [Bifidobacteriaceae bacterium]
MTPAQGLPDAQSAVGESQPGAPIELNSGEFSVKIDRLTGALWSVSRPGEGPMSWVSNLNNCPWLPAGSLWGLGFIDAGP